MGFDVSTVTLQGAQLLASATAADKLILVGCDANSTIYTKAQAVNVTTRPVSPDSTTTNVILEGAYQNHVICRAIFTAGDSTSADVHTLFLYGHRESEPNDNYVIAVLSSNTDIHIPAIGDPINTYSTLFDIVYNFSADTVGTADSSLYTTYAEFSAIKTKYLTSCEVITSGMNDTTTNGNKSIAFKDGTDTVKSYTELTSIVKHVISGHADNGTSLNDNVGMIGLFQYLTSSGYGILNSKSPGTFLDGRNLSPACIVTENGGGNAKIYNNGIVENGKWMLLSYLYNGSSNWDTLILAIKVSNDTYTEA